MVSLLFVISVPAFDFRPSPSPPSLSLSLPLRVRLYNRDLMEKKRESRRRPALAPDSLAPRMLQNRHRKSTRATMFVFGNILRVSRLVSSAVLIVRAWFFWRLMAPLGKLSPASRESPV